MSSQPKHTSVYNAPNVPASCEYMVCKEITPSGETGAEGGKSKLSRKVLPIQVDTDEGVYCRER